VKSVKNFRYVQKTSAECNEDSYLAILHLSRVELHCKLQKKLHRVTWPLVWQTTPSVNIFKFSQGSFTLAIFAAILGAIFFF
jgi:hypothetical protein